MSIGTKLLSVFDNFFIMETGIIFTTALLSIKTLLTG